MKIEMNITSTFPMIDTSGKMPAKGNWQRIVWRKVEKMVFRLQKRIYAATKAGQLKKRNNLVLLHLHCHDQYHAEFTRIKHEERRNNKNLAVPYREMSDIQAELMGII